MKRAGRWAGPLSLVAIVNGRMRSLKLTKPFAAPPSTFKSCDSEWPYEVTETPLCGAEGQPSSVVAIVNGRMRSLKRLMATGSTRISLGCDSEWPYEVTETFSEAVELLVNFEVAIVNGRMRSLKRRAGDQDALNSAVAIVNGRMRSLKRSLGSVNWCAMSLLR